MCGRFVLAPTQDNLTKYYNLGTTLNIDPDYNVSPSEQIPVIIMKDVIDFEYMQWGFIPFWAKDSKSSFKIINARAEDIDEKPTFKKSLISRRCLIPATGFYEWKRDQNHKTPYFFKLKDREIFSFAGLFDISKNEKGEIIKSFTIITTRANKLVGMIHDRMPVILRSEDELHWIDPELVDPIEIKSMLKPYRTNEMITHKVSRKVNNPEINNAGLIEEYLDKNF